MTLPDQRYDSGIFMEGKNPTRWQDNGSSLWPSSLSFQACKHNTESSHSTLLVCYHRCVRTLWRSNLSPYFSLKHSCGWQDVSAHRATCHAQSSLYSVGILSWMVSLMLLFWVKLGCCVRIHFGIVGFIRVAVGQWLKFFLAVLLTGIWNCGLRNVITAVARLLTL